MDSCARRTNSYGALGATLPHPLALVATLGCGSSDSTHEDQRAAVEMALDTLAADLLQNRPPDVAAYRERLQGYLEANPAFFGSAAALLDRSPYVYRTPEGYASTDLAAPAYQIEAQDWFTEPIAANTAIWTEPYFDAGGLDDHALGSRARCPGPLRHHHHRPHRGRAHGLTRGGQFRCRLGMPDIVIGASRSPEGSRLPPVRRQKLTADRHIGKSRLAG